MSDTLKTDSPNASNQHGAVKRPRTVILVKESEDYTWSEVTDVTVVSRFGAGFNLSRECKVGRLVSLKIPMPRELRAYDEDEDIYNVVGLVQHCSETMIDGRTAYHVDVGFIGNQFPQSYQTDPRQSYGVCGTNENGFWKIVEVESQYKSRRHPRFFIQLDVTISLIETSRQQLIKEHTVTKNIGASGVSVACTFDAKNGDKVKFACRDLDFYAIAIVRNRRMTEGHMTTLHLEFVDAKFPMERLIFAESLRKDPSDCEPSFTPDPEPIQYEIGRF